MRIDISSYKNIYVSSDWHFNHRNIIKCLTSWRDKDGNIPKFCRDFPSVETHNNYILSEIEKIAKPENLIIHAGDLSFGPYHIVQNIFDQLMSMDCNWFFINGNHDTYLQSLIENRNKSILADRLNFKYKGINVVIDHFPILNWENKDHGSYHLHGHDHNLPEDRFYQQRSMDIGLDGSGMHIYHLDECISILNSNPSLNHERKRN